MKTAGAFLLAASALTTVQLLDAPDTAQAAMMNDMGTPLAVGAQLSPKDVYVLDEPGRYGLGPHLRGSRYGIAQGQLIRFDAATLEVQSILRRQPRLSD